jgi:hypothetical protein
LNDTTLRTVEDSARLVLAASREGDELRMSMAAFKRLAKQEPVDVVAAPAADCGARAGRWRLGVLRRR